MDGTGLRFETMEHGGEYTSEDFRLCVYDFELTGLSQNGPITVCAPARASTVTHNARQTTPHLSRAFLPLHLANNTVHTNLQGVHSARIHTIDFDATKF
jgi:hypothetical protein